VRLLSSELRLQRVSLPIWTISVLLLVLMIVAVYPSIRDDPSLNSIYESLGPSAQGLLGGSDLTSPVGYLSTQVFAFFLPIVLLVFGLGRGAASVAGEEEGRTLDLLLAQPVTRRSAYLQKAAAVAVGIGLLTVASWLPIVALNDAVKFDLPVSQTLAVCVQMGLFVLGLSLAAQAIAAVTGRRIIGLAAVAGYGFVSYLVYGLADAVPALKHAEPLSLWRWYLGNDPLATGFGWPELAVLGAVVLLALVAGVLLFERRDLRS
jgi:beta-exotoxin I transport system permease protein